MKKEQGAQKIKKKVFVYFLFTITLRHVAQTGINRSMEHWTRKTQQQEKNPAAKQKNRQEWDAQKIKKKKMRFIFCSQLHYVM